MCGGEKRGNTRARSLASPGRAGQAARVHDVRVEWSGKLAPHPCSDAASFCSFVLLRDSDLFCFGNIPKNPLRENDMESG
jgi:hypothetical protein